GETQSRPWIHEAAMLLTAAMTSVYVVNLGYFCEGSLTQLGDYRFVSRTLAGSSETCNSETGSTETDRNNRFAGTFLGTIPVPLPSDYLLGIDAQRCDLEEYAAPSYLRGNHRDTGWWYYYLYA